MTDSIYSHKHFKNIPLLRSKNTGRFPKENTKNQRNVWQYSCRKNVEPFPGEFLFFPTGIGSKSSGKCPKNSRLEYSFYIPLISCGNWRFFWLFSAGSCSIGWPERSPWVIKFSFSRNLSTKYCRPT